MATHILIDTANVYTRARHVTRGTIEDKVGMALHITINSIKKAWSDFNGDHVIFGLEGRSWRKDFYEPYKKNRLVSKMKLTPREQEEDAAFWESLADFQTFVKEKTNCTVLQHKKLEADDVIAWWIMMHPNDNHVIISTDGDYAQLLAPNVKIYNGVSGVTTTDKGYFDAYGKPVKDKDGNEKGAPDPAWLLFEKCMRGDVSDNVFSAYPNVRTKGTKNKVGLLDAFADMHSKGWAWNNMMLQRWTDHEGVERRVIDEYTRNTTLCDLKKQPDDIKNIIKNTILESIAEEKNISQVGTRFIKFCNSYNLVKLVDQSSYYTHIFNSGYTSNGVSEEHVN